MKVRVPWGLESKVRGHYLAHCIHTQIIYLARAKIEAWSLLLLHDQLLRSYFLCPDELCSKKHLIQLGYALFMNLSFDTEEMQLITITYFQLILLETLINNRWIVLQWKSILYWSMSEILKKSAVKCQ